MGACIPVLSVLRARILETAPRIGTGSSGIRRGMKALVLPWRVCGLTEAVEVRQWLHRHSAIGMAKLFPRYRGKHMGSTTDFTDTGLLASLVVDPLMWSIHPSSVGLHPGGSGGDLLLAQIAAACKL